MTQHDLDMKELAFLRERCGDLHRLLNEKNAEIRDLRLGVDAILETNKRISDEKDALINAKIEAGKTGEQRVALFERRLHEVLTEVGAPTGDAEVVYTIDGRIRALADLFGRRFMRSRSDVLVDIARERTEQDRQWGGPHHDDRHTAPEWRRFRAKFEDRADDRSLLGSYRRNALVKIAALAVAQIESIDRRPSIYATDECSMPVCRNRSVVDSAFCRDHR